MNWKAAGALRDTGSNVDVYNSHRTREVRVNIPVNEYINILKKEVSQETNQYKFTRFEVLVVAVVAVEP
jgi:hypothetical protein